MSIENCIKLMEQITMNICSDYVYYPIRKGSAAMAETYVGTKLGCNQRIVYAFSKMAKF